MLNNKNLLLSSLSRREQNSISLSEYKSFEMFDIIYQTNISFFNEMQKNQAFLNQHIIYEKNEIQKEQIIRENHYFLNKETF